MMIFDKDKMSKDYGREMTEEDMEREFYIAFINGTTDEIKNMFDVVLDRLILAQRCKNEEYEEYILNVLYHHLDCAKMYAKDHLYGDGETILFMRKQIIDGLMEKTRQAEMNEKYGIE